MALQYLLIGHLLGDFLLQTDNIAMNKATSFRWNMAHAAILTLCILLFAIPMGQTVILLVLFNGVLHFLIDWLKPRITSRLNMHDLSGFLIDQAAHVLLLLGISLFSVKNIKPFMLEAPFWRLVLVALFVVSFGAILNQFILTTVFKREKQGIFAKGEKNFGLILRFSMLLSLYLVIKQSLIFILLFIPVYLFARFWFMSKWSEWMSTKQFQLKILLDLAISCAGILMIIIL